MAAVAALVAVLGLVAACGGGNEVETHAGSSRPTGADVVVVQVMVAGGFLPPGAGLGTVPAHTVLGDGTVITQGPVPAIYPGPAITPLQATTVDAAKVDDLARRAHDLGLLDGPLDFGTPPVADAPNTTVTITAGGATHRHTATALGIDDTAGGRPGLSDEQVANRRALKDFLAAVEHLPPGDRQWRPTAVAVYVVGDAAADPNLPQPERPWPLAREPASGGAFPCTLFEGDEAQSLLQAVAQANADTPWVLTGKRRALAFRPVVPGQPGCPG